MGLDKEEMVINIILAEIPIGILVLNPHIGKKGKKKRK